MTLGRKGTEYGVPNYSRLRGTMQMKFNPGDRIFISESYSWAKGAKGTITWPPEYVQTLAVDKWPWEKWHRMVKGRKGQLEFYWVEFDNPHVDADGDGPYQAAEIEASALEKIG